MTTDTEQLIQACEEILLLECRKQITRDERMDRLKALWASPAAAGLSGQQKEDIAAEGVRRATRILDGKRPAIVLPGVIDLDAEKDRREERVMEAQMEAE